MTRWLWNGLQSGVEVVKSMLNLLPVLQHDRAHCDMRSGLPSVQFLEEEPEPCQGGQQNRPGTGSLLPSWQVADGASCHGILFVIHLWQSPAKSQLLQVWPTEPPAHVEVRLAVPGSQERQAKDTSP